MMTQSKGIYLLPNILTTAGLLAGFFSIITATRAVYQGEGLFETAAIAILVSGLFDGLDGRVARLTNTQSEFGAQYDSLSDVVAFGVAPAVLVFSWSLSALGKLGWVAAFIYVAGTALRLARFNVQREIVDSNYFVGLACPAGRLFLGCCCLDIGRLQYSRRNGRLNHGDFDRCLWSVNGFFSALSVI
jgi:CDP-diacylglycerol--serine O-phosphatidyltransferase